MAKVCKLTEVKYKNGGNSGPISIYFSYGSPGNLSAGETEFSSVEDLVSFLEQNDMELSETFMLQLTLGIVLLNSNGTLKNFNQASNKTITFDIFAPNPLKVT